MSAEALLTLFCPQCSEIQEVVTEGNNLVCMDCGWKFDDKMVARLLGTQPAHDGPPAAPPR